MKGRPCYHTVMKLWLLLAWLNFTIQILYFFHDESRFLFILKRITTPLLLFGALLLLLSNGRPAALIPALVLAMMGIGEIGMEGSRVVESRNAEPPSAGTLSDRNDWVVVIAGILFLIVNLLLGSTLLVRSFALGPALAALAVSLVLVALMDALVIRGFHPEPAVRSQMLIYSGGLVILFSGVIRDFSSGVSVLGLAAAVLSLSDSLVMIRMGSGWNKRSPGGFRVLLVFLAVILLLYYSFMILMTRSSVPL